MLALQMVLQCFNIDSIETHQEMFFEELHKTHRHQQIPREKQINIEFNQNSKGSLMYLSGGRWPPAHPSRTIQ